MQPSKRERERERRIIFKNISLRIHCMAAVSASHDYPENRTCHIHTYKYGIFSFLSEYFSFPFRAFSFSPCNFHPLPPLKSTLIPYICTSRYYTRQPIIACTRTTVNGKNDQAYHLKTYSYKYKNLKTLIPPKTISYSIHTQ